MIRNCRSTVAAAGLLVGRLLAVRRRLRWLGVPAAAVLVPAGLLATAPAAAAGSVPVTGVALTQAGNDLLMAGAGPNDNLVVWYQAVGSSTWSKVTATAPDTVAAHKPIAITALTEWVGKLRPVKVTLIAMADVGPDGSLNFWWQSLADIGSGPWHQEVLSGTDTIFGVSSIVQIGNEVAIAAGGTGSSLEFWWQQIGATGWNSLREQEPGLVSSVPAMTVLASSSDTLGITFADDEGYVYYVQQTAALLGEGWQGPYTVGSTGVISGAAPSITALGNNLTAITAMGSDGLDQWMSQDPPSFVNTTDDAFPGIYWYGVSTAQLGNGVVAATAQYVDDTLEFYWRLPDGPWHQEALGNPGALNLASPQVIALTNSAGTQLVATAAETPGFGADLYWQTVGSSTWNLVTLPSGSFGY
jgi:hypothetical protein